MVPLRGRIYKPLPGGSIINHKSQKLNYLRESRFNGRISDRFDTQIKFRVMPRQPRLDAIGTWHHVTGGEETRVFGGGGCAVSGGNHLAGQSVGEF